MFSRKFLAIILLAGIFVPAFCLAEDLGATCEQMSQSPTGCPNMSAADCKALLERCANYYDQQSAKISQDLTKTAAQKSTLKSAISSLKKKVQGLEADISQGKIMVKDLNMQISDTQVSIDKTSAQIEKSQQEITSILQAVYEEDQKPSVQILLEGNLSDFFSNVAYLEGLNDKISSLMDSTKDLKNYLEAQRGKMDDNVNKLQKTIAIQAELKSENEKNKKEQEQYLQLTEAQYQKQLQDKTEAEKKAAKIKSMLFQVAGVAKVPTFGEAIEIAKVVGKITNVRPAFLLAIISQESAIGKNVGQCLLTNTTTGEGKKMSSGAYMPRVFKVSRDLQPFLNITASVGRDPLKSPVSCDSYGSMGPAQFLPSTWMLFVDRLKGLLGQTADPWAIKDAFTASALYVGDLGATAQTAAAESKAAYSYNGSGNMARIYSRTVMSRASCIQTFIDNGTMSISCENLIF